MIVSWGRLAEPTKNTVAKNLKTRYILPDGDIVNIFSRKYNDLTESQKNLQNELSAIFMKMR